MNNLKAVLTFGWPYLRRYRGRLFLGILFGILFGVSNGAFIWGTGTLTTRLTPPVERIEKSRAAGKASKPAPGVFQGAKVHLEKFKLRIDQTIDPWLPKFGGTFNWQRFLGGLLFLPLLALVMSATDYMADYFMGWVNERVINDLRIDVLTKLNTLSLDYFNRSRTGDLITRVNVDTTNLHKALKDSCGDLIKGVFQCLAATVMLFYYDWKLTLIALVFLPVCLFPVMVLGRKARRASRSSRRESVSQSSLLVELLAGIRVIKAFNLENHELARFREQSKKMIHHGMKNVQAKGLTNPLIQLISMMGIGGLVVYIDYTQQSMADMVTFLTALAFFFVPFKKLAGVHLSMSQAGAGIERLMETLAEQPTVKEPVPARPVKMFQSQLAFENVSFSYGDKTVLHNINLRLPRGFKLGVAGESGSGKSTLVNLLFRFYDPTQGAIKIDGADLREVSITDLRQQMALVSQEIVLFDKTVAENIECGRIGASRAEIEIAAREAFAHEFIMQLPEGYETRIGERGVKLSGGQRQRICIARAFIRNAPILVLDEATASLDSQSEAEVQVAIERLEENRTVVCVAHRLSTLRTMDSIVVISAGRIVEQGSFADLLKQNNQFARMANRQGIF
ncbi:MAG: ABC transporter ATP-binding protein [Verrucomicrobiota bacterium]